MPFYLFKYQVWKYKFQKLAFTLEAWANYLEIYLTVIFEKIKSPKSTLIGVLLAEHLGDIVAAEPIVEALHQKFPNAKVFWIAKKHFHILLKDHPGIFKVLAEKNIYASTLLTRKNPFDYFYNLHINGTRSQPFYEPLFFNPASKALHLAVDNYYTHFNLLQVFSKYADVEIVNDQPTLHVKEKPVMMPFEGPYWVIHTKSNQVSREWRDEKWEALIPKVLDHFPIHIIEIGMKNSIKCDHPKFHSMVGELALLETIYVLKRAEFFIGIDSGPSHIANALQVPGFLILGNYENFTSYMPFSGAYQKGDITKIYFNGLQTAADHSVEEIWEALKKTYLKHSTLLA